MQRPTGRHLAIFVITSLLALLAACGGSGSSSDSSTGSTHNNADVSFATGMIPHHSQAVEMADLALSQGENPQVVVLAGQIKKAQDPEITTMSSWLTSWGEPIPDTSTGSMGGMDHGNTKGDSMPGMMTSDEMTSLGAAAGTTFDRMWLQMMTAHHDGAVEMSKTELQGGKSADAKSLAQAIIDAQEAEIVTMKGLLSTIKS